MKAPELASVSENDGPPRKVENIEESKKTEEGEKGPVDVNGKSDTTSVNGVDFEIAEADRMLLDEYVGSTIAQQILTLNERARRRLRTQPHDLGKVQTDVITDRDLRTNLHQAIRRIFGSMLDSKTDSDGAIAIFAAPNRRKKALAPNGSGSAAQTPKRDNKFNWDELGGPWLHFTVYKENKDTMEIIGFLARQLKMSPKNFQFAGTKDRRGVTVQRACAFRLRAERLAGLNKGLRNAAVGDFEYRQSGIDLGELNGNEFVITLRDVEFANGSRDTTEIEETVGKSLCDLRERGYLNYYGLQRFGTFSRGTHITGIKILQGDFKGAVDTIFSFAPQALDADSSLLISSEDKSRAEAIHIFQTTSQVNAALDKLPRKFSAETTLIKNLGRRKNDYLGALQQIPRNLRLMYVHAYQSLVWNFAAGERWKLYGGKPVEGDLVLIREHPDQPSSDTQTAVVDEDGEAIIEPQADDMAVQVDDMFLRARPLSAEEVASGKFSIFDVVLPLPGFDVIYPPNQMTDFYKNFMGSEEGGHLDPFDMRRSWKDASLSGSYRKLLSRPGSEYSFTVERYTQDDQQFVQTDMQRLSGENATNASDAVENPSVLKSDGEKIALILKFQLGTSQYATMALRELMKSGGVNEYKPDFGGR